MRRSRGASTPPTSRGNHACSEEQSAAKLRAEATRARRLAEAFQHDELAPGYDVVSFMDSMAALDALETAPIVEVLITRVLLPEGQPNGVSLGLMARLKRPDVKVLFVARPDMEKHTEGVGEFLASRTAAEIVEKVGKMLSACPR